MKHYWYVSESFYNSIDILIHPLKSSLKQACENVSLVNVSKTFIHLIQ